MSQQQYGVQGSPVSVPQHGQGTSPAPQQGVEPEPGITIRDTAAEPTEPRSDAEVVEALDAHALSLEERLTAAEAKNREAEALIGRWEEFNATLLRRSAYAEGQADGIAACSNDLRKALGMQQIGVSRGTRGTR